MTEKERMLAGLEYNACDPELLAELNAVKDLCHEYNSMRPTMLRERNALLQRLLGQADEDTFINQPFYCDYGSNIRVGRRFFANFSLTVLDEAPVTIGDDCFIGPNVSIYTACHSIYPTERNSRREWARPVTIGHNVWIGGSVTILPGVTIGNNVTIGAGAVVTKDVPDNEVWAGNPARRIKHIEDAPATRMTIRKASLSDIPTIQAMADIVFRRTYADILSPEQMDYMMDWMYSEESLTEQVSGNGKEFFIAEDNNSRACGYVSVEKEGTLDDGRPLFHLQKIYVMPDRQKSGTGRQLFLFLMQRLQGQNPDGCRVELNVNRNNPAVRFYERMGMHRDREGDFPIGNGFYMNDYIYAMDLGGTGSPDPQSGTQAKSTEP